MRLSAPIYHLKRTAKRLARDQGLTLNAALNIIAKEEGYPSWSLLAARYSAIGPVAKLRAGLAPGDMVLLGARPGHGKTTLAIELAAETVKSGLPAAFYSFEYSQMELEQRFRAKGADPALLADILVLNTSDAISADHITGQLGHAAVGMLVVIDYLQLLDQNRQNPELAVQVAALKNYAQATGAIIVFISQIDRSYDEDTKSVPGISDVRLPNPLDLNLFTKACFIHDGTARFQTVA